MRKRPQPRGGKALRSIAGATASPDPVKVTYASTAGMTFAVSPAHLPGIGALINTVRLEVAHARERGQFLAYISVPISPRGGGHFDTNNDIALNAAVRLGATFGPGLCVINPARFSLPSVPGAPLAGGAEYMAVWADVLAGLDGAGSVFDMVYFLGPRDVWSYFGVADLPDRIGALERWMNAKAATDTTFRDYLQTGDNRVQFLRYYALRGSVAYSKGGHDEWNVVAALNRRRQTGDDIAVYFNGEPIEPGDYDDQTDTGYQLA